VTTIRAARAQSRIAVIAALSTAIVSGCGATGPTITACNAVSLLESVRDMVVLVWPDPWRAMPGVDPGQGTKGSAAAVGPGVPAEAARDLRVAPP
jgi:hypothetical protein